MSAVRFIDVRKSYDGKVDAVRALNLDVADGEFLTLLGPSGSGKTTTLTMLAGFEQPTEGSIFIGAEDITRVPVEKRGIGMVFQNYALFPNMTRDRCFEHWRCEHRCVELGCRCDCSIEHGCRRDCCLEHCIRRDRRFEYCVCRDRRF